MSLRSRRREPSSHDLIKEFTQAERRVRRLPVGAEPVPGGGVHFRVWAPEHALVRVVIEAGPGAGGCFPLEAEADGYFSGLVPEAQEGTRYRLSLDGDGEELLADPASRFQPEGPHGPSEVVDPSGFRWSDAAWTGPTSREGQVLYELHVGTFTPEGTWSAAREQLPFLADLGVTVLEVMPVTEFPGRFGWSYDGVDLFAPFHGYGTPDDFRRFVDAAHGLGLAVILDVVFHHLGPDGNVLEKFSSTYFSRRHTTEWGKSLNFDEEGSGPVREFVLANVKYWIDEFHLDGMRVDATQSLFDSSGTHILGAIVRTMRAAAPGRRLFSVGESEPQRARLLRPESQGGFGFDMLWSDDFHHTAMVVATGNREAYYGDYLGSAQELLSVLKRGWLYQGQWNLRQEKRRGTPALGVPPAAFIVFLQNHDQIANSARGDRLSGLTDPGRYRALSALLLLGPSTPFLFQGQEFAASTPFLYFGDQKPEIAAEMLQGRREFVRQFPSLATAEMQARIPAPNDPATFEQSVLDHSQREVGVHAEALALHRDLLRLRREDPTLRAGQRPGAIDGAVLGPEAFVLRYFDPRGEGDDRLLLVNLGAELRLPIVAEPLLAPPEGKRWRLLWASESPRYGGGGATEPESEEFNWRLSGHSAVLVAPDNATEEEYRNPEGSV